MSVEKGEWIVRGLDWENPYRIRTWKELVNWINEIGFLPLFGNGVSGFSEEEHTSPRFWWSGNRQEDPWEWREIITASRQVAYGKFFDKKTGFISLEWLPYFVNCRRVGYDFDARWEDGLASRREKKIMDFFLGEDLNGDMVFKKDRILSTDLEKAVGFEMGGEKNCAGVIMNLQMQTYLVISELARRRNKRGEEYDMSVSIMFPPKTLWGYNRMTAAYSESPKKFWQRINDYVRKMYPDAPDEEILRLIDKKPEADP